MTLSIEIVDRIKKCDNGTIVAWENPTTGRRIQVTRSAYWSEEYPDYTLWYFANNHLTRIHKGNLESAGFAVQEWRRREGYNS